jgi:hypothetical protein
VAVFGAIQGFGASSWKLSSISLSIDDGTLIVGKPAAGLLAHAFAELRDDNSLLARRLHVVWVDSGAIQPSVRFFGVVEALPPSGLIGLWRVSGRAVEVTSSTAVNQDKGVVEVGALIHVVGWRAGDKIIAEQITVLESPLPTTFVRFAGPIQELPPAGLIGVWTIGGKQVRVTERTLLQGAGFAQVGAWAEGVGVRRTTDPLTAIWLRARPAPTAGALPAQ